jgi:hypothetical protein
MKKRVVFAAIAALISAEAAPAREPVDYVNPKIGTISHMLVPASASTSRRTDRARSSG